MYEAKFRLGHRGCWTAGLKRFKSEFTTYLTVSLSENFVQDVIEVTIKNNETKAILDYFKSNKVVTIFEILTENRGKMILQVFTDTSKIKSIVYTILKAGCFVPRMVPLVDGWEIWTIAAPSRYRLKKGVA